MASLSGSARTRESVGGDPGPVAEASRVRVRVRCLRRAAVVGAVLLLGLLTACSSAGGVRSAPPESPDAVPTAPGSPTAAAGEGAAALPGPTPGCRTAAAPDGLAGR
ncbi:hypothetical protein AB0M39_35375 [Streptomyces sp. NPDC051907]|uniref:hypothetical protein n=1 Tax=Streptomyces sp. NPDC051907 TaxID=3155284 RepID=UPI003426053C